MPPRRFRLRFPALVLVMLPACAPRTAPAAAPGPEQDEFWARLQQLCGQAFAGEAVEAPPTDTIFAGRPLVVHVRECADHEIRIPLHVGDDRSRTWIVSRTASGLRLKHDHREPDGSPDPNTDYGGETATTGRVWRQEFPADAHSIEQVPARESQLWFLELRPGETLVYGLRREATGLRYRMEFDLRDPVPAPPPPWGH